MLFVCCPTCGFLLADKQIPFENEIKKLNDIENKVDRENFKNNIIKNLNIKRSCCKLRLLTYYDDSKNLI